MKAVIQPLAWGLAMASMLALASGVALDVVVDTAQATVTHDGHGAHAAPPAGGEQQWATDAALREGMTRLRLAAEDALPDDPAQPIGERQALALQKEVEDSVSYLIANCELSAQADAALHGLLADLLGGAEALAVPAERADGVQRIHVALERYPNLFAPPHWNETVISGQ